MRKMIGRSGDAKSWKECPCGWFYQGARCPDKVCQLWKKAHGKKTVKMYLYGNDETNLEKGRELGLEGVALETFSGWDYEIEFDVEVDMEKGEVKILSVDGHDLKY